MLSSCLRQPDKAALQVELHDAQERMQGTVVEYIHGMSVVKVFNRTLSAFRRYEGDLNHFTDVVERTARANARPMGAYYAFFGAQLLFLLPAALLLIPTADSYLDFLPVILLFFLVGGGLKEPLENMMQMVILSSRILRASAAWTTSSVSRSRIRRGVEIQLPSMWNFPMWSLPIPKASRRWIMSLSVSPKER